MSDSAKDRWLLELAEGRTELVFDLLEAGCSADFTDENGVSLMQQCAYYGDVSAIHFLLSHGANLTALGEDLGIGGASYHGHWRLCQFLLEQGADANWTDAETGETPLHNALAKTDRVVYDRVLTVLLAHGANPNVATKPGVETGAFMRDCRTKGETPLHRAAAFGKVETIRMLKDAGAIVDAKDANGETPLSWASWYGRPTPVLRELLYGNFRIHPQNQSMRANLLGKPLI
ncbi:ankyrin repeat domain-containing protein [Acidicapsa acidisoli]|uniref:ankyrin repeat domain-containing protein n=1 Tax=Acidicapsa acidisoli TaxID=1615681 RepID=UPI0021DFDCF1|nr:ankyrin repeat domain-containing protein [Acidicapsa acidisoli]